MGRPPSYLHPHHRPFIDVQLANGNGHISSTTTTTTTTTISPPRLAIPPPLQLNHTEESTRVQLQRQRCKEQHATATVSKSIPGFKTSAVFFASLRTNLRLHASLPPSPVSTPPSMRGSTTSLPPPSPLSTPVDSVMGDRVEPPRPEDPLAGVPELKTYITTDEEEKVAALKLVADSIAQMRQTANAALLSSPLNLAVVVAVVALMSRLLLNRGLDALVVGTTLGGVVMICLAGCRYLTKEYLLEAEAINHNFLDEAEVIITKFGDEVIGTVMIYWVSGEGRQKRKKAWRGEIKAWTVRLKYRKKGVGAALLDDAVKESRKKGAESLDFASDHANALRVLPKFYNSAFDSREGRARELLQDLLGSSPGRSKRK